MNKIRYAFLKGIIVIATMAIFKLCYELSFFCSVFMFLSAYAGHTTYLLHALKINIKIIIPAAIFINLFIIIDFGLYKFKI